MTASRVADIAKRNAGRVPRMVLARSPDEIVTVYDCMTGGLQGTCIVPSLMPEKQTGYCEVIRVGITYGCYHELYLLLNALEFNKTGSNM